VSRSGGRKCIRGARAIVVQDGAVLLIERHRAGRHFFVFPGGKLEPGESDEAALVREVEEETGLIARPERLVAEVTFPDRVQTFWLASVVGGKFGTGTGPEMTGKKPPERGTYRPVWLPVAQIGSVAIYPVQVVAMLRQAADGAWPVDVVRLVDAYKWWA
jgi:8-oxo-dGTP pyrophosphatase MutT (NUDIX family)